MDTHHLKSERISQVARASSELSRREYAWKGARIGGLLGFLMLVSVFVWMARSPDGVEGEPLGVLFERMGTPLFMIVAGVVNALVAILNRIDISTQWTQWVMFPLLYLSVIGNWAILGFLIGWLLGFVRDRFMKQAIESDR
jgi:hypothetical protein